MSNDLLEIARRVSGAAKSGEQVEAYVIRSRETEVEVFGGEVESLTTAVIEGIGVRVVADHRQGYAWAGSLDAEVVEETLRDARDNASFGEPDEWYALAAPADLNGVTAASLDLWRAELADVPTDVKVRIALDLERATKAADPRIRNVESASYGDSLTEAALANSLGVESAQRRTTCSASAGAIADDGTGAQTAYGFVAGRSLADLDLDSGPARRRHARVPAARRKTDSGPADPGDPRPARDAFGARCAVERVQRGVGAEGPIIVRRARRRVDRRDPCDLARRPHRPAVARRGDARQ